MKSKSVSQITKRLEENLNPQPKRDQHTARTILFFVAFLVVAFPVVYVTIEDVGIVVTEVIVRNFLGLSRTKPTTAIPGTYNHALQQHLSQADFKSLDAHSRRAALKHQFLTASHEASLVSTNVVKSSRVLHHPSDKGTDLDRYNIPWQNADATGNHPFQKSRHYKTVDAMLKSAYSDFDDLLMSGWAVNMSTLAPVAASFTPATAVTTPEGEAFFSAARALRDDNVACQLFGTVIDNYARLKRWGLKKTEDGSVVFSGTSKDGNGGRLALELISKLCVESPSPNGPVKMSQWVPRSSADMSKFFYFRRPSHSKYGPHQWMWDSCFHIMVDSHSTVDFMGGGNWVTGINHHNLSFFLKGGSKDANELMNSQPDSLPNPFRIVSGLLELRSLLLLQSPNGFVPEMTYWFPSEHQQGVPQYLFGYSDPGGRATDITQMPMLGMALQRLYVAIRRVERTVWVSSSPSERGLYVSVPMSSTLLLRFFVHKVAGLYRYWVKERDPRGEGLVSIIHPWESGLDASPIYDPVHEMGSGKAAVGSEDCTTAECALAFLSISEPPTAAGMYPRFISRLYQYRHHRGWSLKAILSNPDRFEVQDVGVNAVLAYNIHILHKLVARLTSRVSKHKGLADNIMISLVRSELDSLVTTGDADAIVDGIYSKLVVSDAQGTPVVLSRGWMPSLGTMVYLPADTVQQFFVMLLQDGIGRSERGVHVQSSLLNKLSSEDTRYQITSIEGIAGRPIRDHHTYNPPNNSVMADVGDRVVVVEAEERVVGGGYGVGSEASPITFKEALATLEDGGVSVSRWRSRQPGRDLSEPLLYSTWGVPTTAPTDHMFEAKDSALMWRGPSWPTTNWYVLEGLLNLMRASISMSGSMSDAVRCAIRAKKTFLNYTCSSQEVGGVSTTNVSSMVDYCENGPAAPSSGAGVCAPNFCKSVHMIKSLLQQWVALTAVSGFSEYYNPVTGQPLGQRGLGMSFSLLEVLQRTFGDDGETYGREALGDEQRFRTPEDVGAALVRDIRHHILDEASRVLNGEC